MRTTTVCQAANVELSFTLIADDNSARAKGATEEIARVTQHASAKGILCYATGIVHTIHIRQLLKIVPR